jgi:hypothetical protein
MRAQSEQFAAQRQQSLHRGGVCFAVVTIGQRVSPGGVDMGCSPGVPDIHEWGMSGWIGEDHPAGGVLLAGIVPDGVATITLHYPAANRDPARTVTASVINNVVVFEVPPHTAHQDFPRNVVWRTADGHAINQTTRGP